MFASLEEVSIQNEFYTWKNLFLPERVDIQSERTMIEMKMYQFILMVVLKLIETIQTNASYSLALIIIENKQTQWI